MTCPKARHTKNNYDAQCLPCKHFGRKKIKNKKFALTHGAYSLDEVQIRYTETRLFSHAP